MGMRVEGRVRVKQRNMGRRLKGSDSGGMTGGEKDTLVYWVGDMVGESNGKKVR